MICNLDAGNTRLKWRFEKCDRVQAGKDIQSLLKECEKRRVKLVLVSNVTPAGKHAALWQALQSRGIEIRFARVLPEFNGLRIAYEDEQALGVDRWLAMLAARKSRPGVNLLVVSAGTAITVDYVRASGEHLGGLIVAGVQASAKSLYRSTDSVGCAEITLPQNWQPGRTTLNCVEHGYSALFRGFFKQVLESIDDFESPNIIMTGGDAQALAALIGAEYKLELAPTLVLDGLTIALK